MSTDHDHVPVSDLEPASPSALPRLLGVATALLLVAAVVGAVVVDGGSRPPAERFAAIAAAVAEESFAFEMRVEGTEAGASMPIGFSVVGAVDPATKRTRAEMDLSAILPAGMSAGKFVVVSDGDVLYLQSPTGLGAKPWVKLSAASLAQGMSGGIPSSTNPMDTFAQLRAVDAVIEEVGQEDVRGTPTTHFRTRLDLGKVVDQLPAGQVAPQTADALRALSDVPVDVWLDDQDRPRRQRVQYDLAALGQSGTVTLTIEAFDFGKAVDIELPTPDQVNDAGSGLDGQFLPRGPG